eukprot:CAMPEP_0119398588 /NCGR_PEP_ID=MMETSP1334-20130426/140919_1 /TAXON_ID=127549 /ORGANISM="Calcidiscus leptoporus, Strain RCC1130" /LENGTH=180 /DNA_ID=CAMNT_0007422455 /DNA_START=560 /DNA_END=1102 /DNA_ORIENTATION=+
MEQPLLAPHPACQKPLSSAAAALRLLGAAAVGLLLGLLLGSSELLVDSGARGRAPQGRARAVHLPAAPIVRALSTLPAVAVSHKGVAGSKRVLLKRGEVPHIAQFAQSTLGRGAVVERHRHTGLMEVYFVEGGSAAFTLGGKAHALEVGHMIAIPEGTEHWLNVTGPSELRLTYFMIDLN